MTIRETIRTFVLKNFYVSQPDGLTDDASLIRLGIVDSTGIMEVIGFIEEEFRITVTDQETIPGNLESIERISAYIARKVESRSASRTAEAAPLLDARAAS